MARRIEPEHERAWNDRARKHIASLNHGPNDGNAPMIGPGDVEPWNAWAAYYAHIGHEGRMAIMERILDGDWPVRKTCVPTLMPDEFHPGWRATPGHSKVDWPRARRLQVGMDAA